MGVKLQIKKIKKMMIDKELKQTDLSALLGIHKSTLRNALSGYRQGPKSVEVLNVVEHFLRSKV